MVSSALAKVRKANVKQYLPTVNKNYVWGTLAIGAIIAGIYWWGKNNASIDNVPVPDDTIDPNKPLTDAEKAEVKTIAVALFNEIDKTGGSWIRDWDVAVLERFMQTSDRIFVSVCNYYNSNYTTAPDTLTSLFVSKDFWIWGGAQSLLYKNIIARMSRLQLR
jgi:hypothetical protein